MKYTSRKSLSESIHFFKEKKFKDPHTISLFLVLKSMGVNAVAKTRSLRTGNKASESDNTKEFVKDKVYKSLHELAALFSYKTEEGGMMSALFPFSLHVSANKKARFYNAKTEFKSLPGRIADTLTNSKNLSKILDISNSEDFISFRTSYVQTIKEILNGEKIPLFHLAAWIHRFIGIDAPDTFSNEQIKNISALHFLSSYHITKKEFKELFTTDPLDTTFENDPALPEDFRELIHFEKDLSPEIKELGNAQTENEKFQITGEQCADYQKRIDNNDFNVDSIIDMLPDIIKADAIERNKIIFGAPGTGKSYKLNKDAEKLLNGRAPTRVTFHPEYSYFNFVGSYKPIMRKTEPSSEEIAYDFVPGPFTEALIDALKDPHNPHLLIIEEINRARVAAVFGDIFQLLDRTKEGKSEYPIKTPPEMKRYLEDNVPGKDCSTIKLPENLYIWATMNSADQGVFPMDTAFKRRWDFEYIGVDHNQEHVSAKLMIINEEYDWNDIRRAINSKLEILGINEDKMLGAFFIAKKYLEPLQGNEADSEVVAAAEKRFLDVFKSKVISYLFEDAAKHKRQAVFEGCTSLRYSEICKEFDEKGLGIFGESFFSHF